ncbi:S1C family serine protease [Nocardioides marmorisolisilvae]|uniref:PDZ domain-containing protein n=1 Tax=Nocardioides marmorisolisilvae TaxID=1542737 RepID=A0A3N0E0M4_9ACTN|nr:trypsin-like peptidase domain-containing protein [Nocardioides marmorisolisilvae]RNL81392.1 PDZ domain-containing protein [Nocardioides marmorisolisilvae]
MEMTAVETTEPSQEFQPQPGPEPRTRRYRGRATVAALGLLASSAVVGSVYAVHHHGPPPTSSAQRSPYVAEQAGGWGGYSTQQLQPYSRQYSDQPYTGQQGTTTTAAETASDASSSQSVGIVEITSTLANGAAKGTGLVLSADGTIVTNHHVVAGATSIKVTVVSTGKTYTATFLGADATHDVAVLKLQGASGLTPASFASSAAAVGDAVTAVGDAGGDGGSLTASPGTVTGVDQSITVQDDNGGSSRLSGLIELHAYVVPGDSGGAVLNKSGDVVGMNVAASSGSRDVTGYAIPIAQVRSIAAQIIAGNASADVKIGYSGYLGVELSAASNEPVVAGVESGGAAADAGIKAGDTITRVNGVAVTSAEQLHDLIAAKSPGDRVYVSWKTSAGVSHSATVTLGSGPVA